MFLAIWGLLRGRFVVDGIGARSIPVGFGSVRGQADWGRHVDVAEEFCMSSFPQNHARSRLTWADRRPSRADLFLGIYSYIVKTCGSIDAESSVGSGAYGSKSRSAVSLTNVVTHAEYE